MSETTGLLAPNEPSPRQAQKWAVRKSIADLTKEINLSPTRALLAQALKPLK